MSICMCSTLHDCGLKNECYRFRKEPNEFWQPWANMYQPQILSPIGDSGQCVNFIPIEGKKDLRK